VAISARAVTFIGPKQVEVRERVLPDPRPGEVVVETLYSGISGGTEMNVFRGLAPQWRSRRDPVTGLFKPTDQSDWSYPLTYGYAAVGRIAEIAGPLPNGSALSIGDLVYSYTAHASVSVVAGDAVVRLPALDDPRTGVFLANLNTALNGLLDARPTFGDVVVVSGLGVIGLLTVQLLRLSGTGLLIAVDAVEHRRDLASRFGADVVISPRDGGVAERVRSLTENRGADIVLEASGSAPALNEAVRTVGYGAKVVVLSWYGGSLDSVNLSGEFHHNRPRIISSQVGGINPDLGPLWHIERRKALATNLVPRLELEPLVTHEFPVEEAAKAYALVDEGNEDLVQCVLSYPARPASGPKHQAALT